MHENNQNQLMAITNDMARPVEENSQKLSLSSGTPDDTFNPSFFIHHRDLVPAKPPGNRRQN